MLLRATLLAFALLLLVNSCTEQKIVSTPIRSTQALSTNEVEQSATTSSAFNKWIGSPIDRATAVRWKGNFAKTNAYTSVSEHFIPSTVFKQIISNAVCVGVSLHYSLDDLGQLHIIPVGIDGNGKVIANSTIAIDGLALDWETQQLWISKCAGKRRSHFFGTLTFTRLLEKQQAQTVRISRAIDDSGNPQLLLSDANVVDPNGYEDASSPCPPICPS